MNIRGEIDLFFPIAYNFQSVHPTYTVSSNPMIGEPIIELFNARSHLTDPFEFKAYKFPFQDPITIVPSVLILADEVIMSPVSYVQANLPSLFIAYNFPSLAPTYTVPSLATAGVE